MTDDRAKHCEFQPGTKVQSRLKCFTSEGVVTKVWYDDSSDRIMCKVIFYKGPTHRFHPFEQRYPASDLKKISRWVEPKDELPNDSSLVLFRVEDGFHSTYHTGHFRSIGPHKRFIDQGTGYVPRRVSHWQYIEPPDLVGHYYGDDNED